MTLVYEHLDQPEEVGQAGLIRRCLLARKFISGAVYGVLLRSKQKPSGEYHAPQATDDGRNKDSKDYAGDQ